MKLTTPITPRTTPVTDIELDIRDNAKTKTITLNIAGFRSLTLWRGAEYDAIGNWTPEQAEARIRELEARGDLAACFR